MLSEAAAPPEPMSARCRPRRRIGWKTWPSSAPRRRPRLALVIILI
ncbi:MAG: hypothetical protein ACLUEK_03680 [Oscillospiraceae bacterium]